MRVVHWSTHDVSGGAARAAFRLHKGLQQSKVNSSMYVLRKNSNGESVQQFELPDDLWSRIRRRWRAERIRWDFSRYSDSRPANAELFSDDRSAYGTRPVCQAPQADVINLHWVAKFVDISAFFQRVSVPVVWTLHDMNPFTGGCHYSFGCQKFQHECGACPALGSELDADLSRSIWERKNQALPIDREKLKIVADSNWLASQAKKSSLFGDLDIRVIHYGLDANIFKPRGAKGLRKALGVPSDAYILLFVAHSTTAKRKGFSKLAEALQSLEDRHSAIHLVSVGSNRPNWNTSLSHLHLGKVSSDLLLAAVYSMSDVFVIPSLQEAFGQTALEAMACGTPVAGFDTGGIPDMVRQGETGWLAEKGDVRELREAILAAFSNDKARERMGRRCREMVEAKHTLEDQARKYVELYEETNNKKYE